jgi:hypothetical protein
VKRILETLFLAVSFAFVGWLVINAGVKFEVKIAGKEYGFSISPSLNKATKDYLQLRNSYQEIYCAWADRFLIDLPARDSCLRYLYPQFNKIEILGASENSKVFFIICSDKAIMSIEYACSLGVVANTNRPVSYSVI